MKLIPSLQLWVLLCCGTLALAGGSRADAVPQNDASVMTGPSSAQDLKHLSLEELGNVEVTTYNKAPTELWDTPAAMYVITDDDIRRSGATSIADALRLAPGVEVGRLSSTTWAVGIRGLQNNFSKSVLVLIDGRSVYTPLFAGVYWDVQDMPLDNIDRIEVIRGPGGTIWGPNAANGVINIITKKTADTQGVMADALIGTQDHTVDDLQYGVASQHSGFRIFGRGFERAHEYHTDGINEDAWHQERFGFRADHTAGRDTMLAEGDIYGGNSPHILGTTPVYDHTSGGDLNLRWQRDFNQRSGFYLQTYFERTLRTATPLSETRNTVDIDFIHHLTIAQNHHFTYGAGLRWSPYQIIAQIPTETLVPSNSLDHAYTGFLQDEIRLRANLYLTGGAKFEHNNYSGFDIQPSARLLWSPREHEALWTGITRAVTTPSDIEEDFLLEGGGPKVYVQLLGNRHFQSEDLIGYEAGYRHLFGDRLLVDLEGFWNQNNRLQSFSAPMVTTSNGNTYINIQYTNQINGSTSGAELAPQVTVTNWWRIDASYSFLNSDFSANGPTSDISSTGSVSTYEGSSPKHIVWLQSKIDLPWHVSFDQMYRYVSGLRAQKVPSYQTMDAHLEKAIGRGISLEIVGQNLFQNHHYEWGSGDPSQPPVGIYRAGYIRLSLRPHRSAPAGPHTVKSLP